MYNSNELRFRFTAVNLAIEIPLKATPNGNWSKVKFMVRTYALGLSVYNNQVQVQVQV